MPIVSKDAYKRSLAKRVSMNRQIMKNPYWFLPVDDSGHENYMPVGRGERSSLTCSSWRSFSMCDNIEGHKGKSLHGVDCTNKMIVKHNHLWCNKASCSVCFIRGWSVNRARSVEGRLLEGEKRGYGEIYHCMVSVPVADRSLSEFAMRKKARLALKNRGMSGGAMIFHGFRIDKERQVLTWSCHYHYLGFIKAGYFEGFEARTREWYKKDGCIVRVFAKRKTVFGTAWYQINHATIRLGVKRHHVITWMGNCAKHMFKSAKVKAQSVCAVCGEDMVKAMYMGKKRIVKDIGHVDYVPVFAHERLDENGELYFVPIRGSRVGSFG